MAKHTPGPWEVTPLRSGDFEVSAADPLDYFWLAKVQNAPEQQLDGQANAALIAVAPELLEALKDLVDSAADISMTFDGGQSDSHARLTCRCKFCALERSFLLARDAIAKAEGVSK